MNHYSQRDTRWKDDIIGNSENQTIGEYGCLLTSVAMVCTEFGHTVNPGELNELYQDAAGFDGASLIIRSVTSFYPDICQAELIPCGKDIDAPLMLIDRYLLKGIPVIVQLDQSPVEGHQEHWVVITEKQNGEYIIDDPWDLESSGTFLIEKYGFDSQDPAIIITSVLVLNHTQAAQELPVNADDDEYNATIVAPHGAALRRAPWVEKDILAKDTLLVYLPAGTRLCVGDTVKTLNGYTLRAVLCYMAEADMDGTPILKVDDDA